MIKYFLIILLIIPYYGYSQVIAIQSFEQAASDTWTPATFSVPACNSSGDIWDYSTSIGSISPSHLAQFWGIKDLNGNCGGSGFESITLPNVDVSACTAVNFSFDYNVFEFDNGDDIKYELFFDNLSQGQIVIVNGSSNFSTGGWVTETVAIPAIVVNVSVIISVKQNGGGDYAGIDNVKLEGTCTPCPGLDSEPVNEATGQTSSAISCTEGTVSWTNGAGAANTLVVMSTSVISGVPTDGVAYNASTNFGSGDILNAGEFVVYNGGGATVNVSGLADNITYFVAIFEYNGATPDCEENYLTGGVTTSFTTMTGCAVSTPQITSILYNSCNGSNEGTDEIFTFTTGSNSVDIDDITIDYPGAAPDYCNSGCGANTNINNPVYVTDLNTVAGCVIFAYVNPIPPNSDVMVFTGNPPSTTLDYSSQCGSANLPIYVFFNNNSSTSGRFANYSGAPRTLTVDFGGGNSDAVTYVGTNAPNADGSTVYFDEPGNATYFNSNDCVYPLPIELKYFKAEMKKEFNMIVWGTNTERNNAYFEIEKSTNGINFSRVGKVNGTGNSVTEKHYSYNDFSPSEDLVYYRLKQFDYNGEFKYSYPIKLIPNNTKIYYSNNLISINIDKPKNNSYLVNIYNLSGQLVKSFNSNGQSNIDWNYKGFFIVEIPELEIRTKIITQ